MRLTRLGAGCAAMAALSLLVAASTGNNLLYLVYGALVGVGLSTFAGLLSLRRIQANAETPDQIFRGQPFNLRVRLTNTGLLTAYGIEASWQGSRAMIVGLKPGESQVVELRGALPHRGLNVLTDLVLETTFPFALVRFRRRLASPPRLLAFPRVPPIRDSRQVSAQARASGRPTMRKGGGEELYGVREYGPGDDARSLNWKLTARAGRPLVNEHCAAHDDRITVAVDAARGEASERAIEDAAAACRFHVDAGAQVRLESAEESVDYGRGLLQLERLLRALARLGDGREARATGEPPALRAEPPADSPALRRLTLACVTSAYLGLFLVDEVAPSTLLALSPLILLAWPAHERGWRVLPRAAWNALSVAVLAYTAGLEWRTAGVTAANVHLLLYLVINRALSPLDREELPHGFLVSLLAFFLTSGLTISVWYFGLLLVYVGLAGAWLMAAGGLPWDGRARWLGGLGRSLATTTALAALLFTATPRVEGLRRINPFLAAGLDKLSVPNGSVTAFTDDVSLGFFGRIRKSSARVMRVKPVPAPEGVPPALHVRGSAFDLFDGRRWSRSAVDFGLSYRGRRYQAVKRRVWAQPGRNGLEFPAASGAVGQPAYDFTIYPMNLAVLFTVGTPWLVTGANQAAWFDHTDGIQFSSNYQGGIRYAVHPSPDGGFGAALSGYEPAMTRRYLQLPADPAGRVAALARQATAGADDAPAKISAVQRFLRKRYGYALYDSRTSTLEDFLFKTRKGNCEYFATAGAVLLRHSGVPARLVSGFLAGDWNEYGKFYDVRQAEAHAWVEAYVPGRGWVTLDPTPSQSALLAGAEELSRRLEHWFASLETGWYRHVIGYDQYVQRDTLRRVGAALSPRVLRGAARGAAAGALLLGGPWLAFWGARRLRAWLKAPAPSLFARAEAALARAGLAREAAWTAREFAREVVSRRPELAAVTALAELHYRERFDPRGLPEADADQARRLLGDLRRALGR